MIQKKMKERIRHYLEDFPDIDAGLVLEGLLLLSLHHEVDMLSETLHGRMGLNSRQMETLEILFHLPERTTTPARLADSVHLTRSAMTSNLDSLERRGYLSRSTHKRDRRMVAVKLTEKGIRFCEENLPVRYRDMAKVISIFSPDERLVLNNAYHRALEFMKQALKEDTIEFFKTSSPGV